MKTIYSLKNALAFITGSIIIITSSSFSPGPPLPGNEKITICHLPPGNNQNRQTIEVSINALQAHLDHGDFIGSCEGDGGMQGLWCQCD